MRKTTLLGSIPISVEISPANSRFLFYKPALNTSPTFARVLKHRIKSSELQLNIRKWENGNTTNKITY